MGAEKKRKKAFSLSSLPLNASSLSPSPLLVAAGIVVDDEQCNAAVAASTKRASGGHIHVSLLGCPTAVYVLVWETENEILLSKFCQTSDKKVWTAS
jgi:hypothetical protein